ncbi:putative transcription factor interactor and regulator CCHC(Zn) family [Helianthus annuus]|nr:putative transcription factor interactor and regulator CCHC(Zn) family [Helianthus annuus]
MHKIINVYTNMKELFSSPSKPSITIEEIVEIGPYAIVPMKENANVGHNIGHGESSREVPVNVVDEMDVRQYDSVKKAWVETEVNVTEDRDVSEDRNDDGIEHMHDNGSEDRSDNGSEDRSDNDSKVANGGRVGALESWVHPVYTMERWKQVYSFRVNPINGRTLWTKVHAPTTITPPKYHTQVGRPNKLRQRSVVELEEMTQSGRLSKKHTKGVCSKCKKTGYNSRTCKGQGEAVKTGKSGKSGKAGKSRKAAAK